MIMTCHDETSPVQLVATVEPIGVRNPSYHEEQIRDFPYRAFYASPLTFVQGSLSPRFALIGVAWILVTQAGDVICVGPHGQEM